MGNVVRITDNDLRDLIEEGETYGFHLLHLDSEPEIEGILKELRASRAVLSALGHYGDHGRGSALAMIPTAIMETLEKLFHNELNVRYEKREETGEDSDDDI